jgi:hypothetical protein
MLLEPQFNLPAVPSGLCHDAPPGSISIGSIPTGYMQFGLTRILVFVVQAAP